VPGKSARTIWPALVLALCASGGAAVTLPLIGTAATIDAVAQRIVVERAALRNAEAQAVDAERRAQAMATQASTIRDAAERDRVALAALALRIQSAEADLAAVRAQGRILAALERRQRARLAQQQRPISELLATLQLLTRRPPLTLLAQPGAARDIVHMRALIDALLPQIRARTASLRTEIDRSRQLRVARQRSAQGLIESQQRLADRRSALSRSEAQQRSRAASLAAQSGFEQDRAIALGQDAEDIGDLVGALEASGNVRDRLAALAGPVARPGSVQRDGGGAAASSAGTPAYRLPVVGTIIRGLGEVSNEGTRSRGLTISAAAGAQVVAPASGRVSYAGRFRSYGVIIIIDHGGGWSTLVTNMIAVSPRVGDRVVQGAPIGRVGPGNPQVTVELRRGGQPIDIATLVS
jgi:septal ring factor EnvC (AmiA/AmiB activator)